MKEKNNQVNELVVLKSTQLTIKEEDAALVQMAADGLSRIEMAKKTKKSKRTIESRFEAMKDVVDAKSLSHLTAIFFRKGFIK